MLEIEIRPTPYELPLAVCRKPFRKPTFSLGIYMSHSEIGVLPAILIRSKPATMSDRRIIMGEKNLFFHIGLPLIPMNATPHRLLLYPSRPLKQPV